MLFPLSMKPPSFLFLAAAVSLATGLPCSAAPYISEFQADNEDTLTDEDGATSDWIEIYNPETTAVNMAGMFLTDDPALPQKWIFPAVSIPPRNRLLVWASVKNRTNPAEPLHTNFDLAAAGEYLALTAADGTTKLSEFNTYPAQPPDRSYGITSEVTITEKPLADGAACKWLVPSTSISGWQNPGFDATAWPSGATGIGYDRSTTSVDYNPYIGAGGNVESQMFSIRGSCYIRVPFTFNGLSADVTSLKLRMRFDDGFAAFLNGTRLNPPSATASNAPATLAFNSVSSAVASDSSAVTFITFDITGQKNLLLNGANVLAIHALNQATNSSDLLITPEIEVTRVDSSGPTLTGYFAIPTPDAANTLPPVAGFVDEVDYSIHRGIYSSPQSLALTCTTPGAQIRYTTNGSRPTASTGSVYGTPLNISASAVIRAAAFVSGWEPSRVKTHTYVFGQSARNQPALPSGYPSTWGNEYNFTNGTLTGPPVPADYRMDPGITTHATYGPLIIPAITETLPIVCLTGNISDFFDFTNGIYCNRRLEFGVEIPASMEYFDPHSPANWQEDMGLRMHGGDAPLEHPKKPFRAYFRKIYGEGRLRHSLFPGSPVDSFDKLQFRPLGHDGWAVPFGSGSEDLARHAMYCRDRFLRQTELDMGRLAHYGKYVHLFINGLYWGFYDLHEVQSMEYWADHKGGLEEDWDVLEHSNANNPLFDVVDGSDVAMNAALALVRPASNAASPATFNALAQYLDYTEFIDNMIVQMWGAQNDWMGPVFRGIPGVNLTDATRFTNKNWQAAIRSRGPEPGRLFWQTWDAEISMGTSLTSLVATMRVTDFNHTLVGTPSSDIPHVTGQPGSPGPAAEIWYALRKHNPVFRMMVADRLQRHFFNDGAMTVANNLARLQTFRDLLDLPIVAESARWGDVNTGNPLVVTFNRDDHWRSEMSWMRDAYISGNPNAIPPPPGRNDTMLAQMAAIGMWPATLAPSFSQHGGSVPAGYQLTISDPNAGSGTIYYTLDGTDPMSVPTGGSTVTLAGPEVGTIAAYKVPDSQYSGNSWKDIAEPSDAATWTQGPIGLGFDASGLFAPHFTTTVNGMNGVNASLYLRIPFSLTAEQKAQMTSLTLKLKYDDGAFIWLNASGPSAPLYRLNGANSAPTYNMTATSARSDAAAVVYEDINLTPQIAALSTSSPNVLAIQGLNITAADDDFLCTPELVGTFNSPTPPSATALTYSAPVALSGVSTVKARVLKDGVWSPLIESFFIVGQAASAANLVISEFSYNPVASPEELLAGFTNQQFEFMELLNISASPVELTGCRFDDGITFNFSTDSSVQTIPPGGRILLISDAAAFAARHPGVPFAGVFQEGGNLSNGGERLELLAADGSDIFDFVYDDTAPWPASADGGGYSLVLINPTTAPDPAVPSNWRASVAPGGTPDGEDADTIDAWMTRNNIPGRPTGDPDGNGLQSLAEYGLGVIPGSGDTDGLISVKFETVVVDGVPDTYLVLRCRRNAAADDVLVAPEMSTDMATWAALSDAVPPESSHPDGTYDIVRRSPQPVSAGDRIYVRVLVTLP
jgi:hypothetical protein